MEQQRASILATAAAAISATFASPAPAQDAPEAKGSIQQLVLEDGKGATVTYLAQQQSPMFCAMFNQSVREPGNLPKDLVAFIGETAGDFKVTEATCETPATADFVPDSGKPVVFITVPGLDLTEP